MKRKFRVNEFAEETRELIEEVRATHPPAKMSEEKTLVRLHWKREIVTAERHEKGEFL